MIRLQGQNLGNETDACSKEAKEIFCIFYHRKTEEKVIVLILEEVPHPVILETCS